MCPTLGLPADSTLVPSGNTFGSTANHTGYSTSCKLVGESILTCVSDSQWSASPHKYQENVSGQEPECVTSPIEQQEIVRSVIHKLVVLTHVVFSIALHSDHC